MAMKFVKTLIFKSLKSLYRPGGESARCDQMWELDKYTFLEFPDHVDNGKSFFFINFGATSFLRKSLNVVKYVT